MSDSHGNRWLIAIMGTVLQLVLGSVYAWSYFQKPIMATFGWSNVQVMWIFSISICFLGLAAAWGGMNLSRLGPKKLALTGAVLWGGAWLISAWAISINSLVLFYFGFGIVGGIGLGLGYVTPVATAAGWFPDKRGFVTGMVVMGFGFGALMMSKIVAPAFMAGFNRILSGIPEGALVSEAMKATLATRLSSAFLYIGLVVLAMSIVAASFMKNPPAGYVPAGFTPPNAGAAAQGGEDRLTVRICLTSGKFMGMWLILFLNVSAGIIFIGLQSPMLQDLMRKGGSTQEAAALAAAGGTLIAISSIFNGIGRFFWGGLSDKIGRIQAFRLILGTQAIVFLALIPVGNPWIFGLLVCYVLLCYGGGFGTMPSFVVDVFTARLMPTVYGVILTAWAAAGIVGPQIAAFLKDTFMDKASLYTFITGAVMLIIGALIAFTLDNKPLAEEI